MEKKDMTTGLAIIVLVMLLLGILVGINVTPGETTIYNTDSQNLNLLSVSSTVSKDVAPDRVEITLSVLTLEELAKESQQENARITSEVVNALKLIGVKESEMETNNYSVREESEWDYQIEKRVTKGFRTTNSIKITLSQLDKAGDVIDAATIAGANSVSGIVFTLSKEKQQQAKENVLSEASSYARVKANAVGSGLNVTIGKVHSVTESSYSYVPNYYNYEMAGSAVKSDSVETPISPGDVSVSATVSVEFEI